MKKFSILRQYIAPQHLISWIFGWFSECRILCVKNWMIATFIKKYQVDMQLAQLETIEDYPTFNSFFTRQLKPHVRPVVQRDDQVACPVDGLVSQVGNIEGQLLFQAKGFYFDLTALLGGREALAAQFLQGSFATLYLAPRDYHRVHMPFAGQLRETIYIPGKLFSVNQETVRAVPHLFSRNERVVCLFDTQLGPMAVILVGAMIVGSIQVAGQVGATLAKGAELGYFKLGSTVIVLFPKETVTWNAALQENALVRMGEQMGTYEKGAI